MTKTPTRLLSGMRRYAATHPVLVTAFLATMGLATAAITVTYTTASTLATSVVAAPVQFVAGDDSAIARYVNSYSLSNNKTYFSASVNGIPEGTVTMSSFVKIQNVDSASHQVTLATTQASAAGISAFTLELRDTTPATQATLTFTDASPSATVTIPAGETWSGRLVLTLGTAAGLNNATVSKSLSLTIVT